MSIRPTGYLKQVLSDEEEVLLITRQHWLALLGRTLMWIVLLVVCLVGAAILAAMTSPWWPLVLAFSLIPLAGWFWEHLVWANDMNVMTDRRVIQMSGVFNKHVSDSMLDKLNDVKTQQSFLGRLLGYGDIELLTASEAGVNNLRMIQNPLGFKREMLNAKERLYDDHGPRPD